MRAPSPADIRTMLSDICTNSGADLAFEKFSFSINGSDDAVKAAMIVIYQIPFVKRAQYQMRVKIELANEHKEFVSGKKNGKINKIMGQSTRSQNCTTRVPKLTFYQATYRSSSTASTSTTSALTYAGASTRQRRTASTLLNRKCQRRFPSMYRISTTSALLASEVSTFSAS